MKDPKILQLKPVVEVEEVARVVYKEVITYDENGEVVYDTMRKVSSPNGGGFVISYTEKMCDFISKCRTGSVVRLFLYVAHHQSYGNDGIQFGYRCSRKFLEGILGLDRKSVYSAIVYLKDKFLLHEMKIDGQTEYMVNPAYVTIGADKKRRVVEWERRWRFTLSEQKANRA